MTTYHYISESAPKFRIGGVYRDGHNRAYLLRQAGGEHLALAALWKLDGGKFDTSGELHRLDNGRFDSLNHLDCKWHLIPGELTLRDGQWVPLEQTASLTFPGGGCVQLAGEKVIGRTAPEPVRAPLDWNTTTKHDTFGPDFIVTKGEVPTAPLYDSPTTHGAYPAIAGLLLG